MQQGNKTIYSLRFLLVWLLVLILVFLALRELNVLPEELVETSTAAGVYLETKLISFQNRFLSEETSDEEITFSYGEVWAAGATISIPVIGLEAPIVFPEGHDFKILNEGLLRGAVWYPGSALPGGKGNMLVFGHSSYLPVIQNPSYKVFSGLQKLEPGDFILIKTEKRGYLYRVLSLAVKKADDAKIDFASERKLLTLSTCKIFGGKELRWVVEAEFVKSYSAGNISSPNTSS